mgnify:CR=1 FL=1
MAHYADAACDIEFNFPFVFKELEGIHSRTDFDLSSHEKFTGKKLRYFDPELNENYVPYVVETSIGLDRMFLAVLSNALKEEKLEGGATRVVLKFPYALAPNKEAVLPLVKNVITTLFVVHGQRSGSSQTMMCGREYMIISMKKDEMRQRNGTTRVVC